MFGLSAGECLIVAIVALLVVGPEKLPAVARTLGLLFGRLQRYTQNIKQDLAQQLHHENIMAEAAAWRAEQDKISQSLQDALHAPPMVQNNEEAETTEWSATPPNITPLEASAYTDAELMPVNPSTPPTDGKKDD
jgi:sec-independent protein translocase protein TatB